jgi:hypothetical protein
LASQIFHQFLPFLGYSHAVWVPARVEKFCSNFVIRKLLGNITVLFVEAAVERMFNADEVTSIVDLAKLECLRRKIVSLFFTQ